MPELDQLSIAYIQNAFRQLGFDPTIGRRLTSTTEAARLANRRATRASICSNAGAARRRTVCFDQKEDGYVVSRKMATDDPASRCTDLLLQFGDDGGELELLRRCGGELASVLRGEQDPLPLLFPQGSSAVVRRAYADSPYARTFNSMLAELIRRAIAQCDHARPLRVLEIGAGTGSTTSVVLPLLAQDTDYTFTDISPLFLAQATEQFRNYPQLRTALLDIERDPQQQGFDSGAYDIVIAANVLHATADIRQTMDHVASLLAPGGLLFVVEAVKQEPWVDLTFGLTEGWWRFTDVARRRRWPIA